MNRTTRKIIKLVKNPRLYFFDYLNKRRSEFDSSFREGVESEDANNNKKEADRRITQEKATNKTNKNIKKMGIGEKSKSAKTNGNLKADLMKAVESALLSEVFPDVSLENDVKNYIYIPWIKSHTNTLIDKIKSKNINISEFRVLPNGVERKNFLAFCRENPQSYRKYLFSRLIPIKNKISGLIVTLDWTPAMRIPVEVCKEIGIKTILIPHESVFLDEQKYYWDIKSNASCPCCDLVLCWGGLQKRIFTERGYPEKNIIIVGSPKLDFDATYVPQLSREQFCRIYGLSAEKKIILFCAQYLDSQVDFKTAMAAQISSIVDLVEICEKLGHQLIIRTPPNGANIIKGDILKWIKTKDFCFYENPKYYLTEPSESIANSDLVVSMNSTMLFEAVIMGTPSLSARYFNIKSIWKESIIPIATTKPELEEKIDILLSGRFEIDSCEFNRLKSEFGIGEFDGKSTARIQEILKSGVDQYNFPTLLEKLLNKDMLDVCCIPSSEDTASTSQKYLKNLINCRTLLNKTDLDIPERIASTEAYFQWGGKQRLEKVKQRKIAKQTGKPVVFLEDGFIRSLNIGLSKEAGLSILWDDLAPYYDSNSISRMEKILSSDFALTENEMTRAKWAIDKIVSNKISKYNNAPRIRLNIGRKGRKRVLLVDQRYEDMSVILGQGGEHVFNMMLQDALSLGDEWDIFIKQHPDAICGEKTSYLNEKKLRFAKYCSNVFLINYDVNPYSLLELVDEVYVCSSGMGFEALMAGKKVTCYGSPFYSGWGLTKDKIELTRRGKRRSLEEIFFVAYIMLSRYYNPESATLVDVEDICDYIITHR